MRSLPQSRLTTAAVPTTGTAYPIPAAASQIKVFVDGLAYVGVGTVLTPIPATAVTNSVYQEADTEVVYEVLSPASTGFDHLYIYAATGTVEARVSFFG